MMLFLASLGIYKLDFYSCTKLLARSLLLLHAQFCCHLTKEMVFLCRSHFFTFPCMVQHFRFLKKKLNRGTSALGLAL